MSQSSATHSPGRARRIGLPLGPLVAITLWMLPTPHGLTEQGWSVAALGLWMAVWWMTEAVPLAVTALLPLVAFPLLGARSIEQTAASYAHPLIFLFLGGFLLARAMHVWTLDRRLAVSVLEVAGSDPRRVMAALMGVTAFLSMWVSNTATTMVMLPIALSVTRSLDRYGAGVTPAVLLGIAYAATIGGMGSLVGTPPNALFASFMSESYGIEIGFARWMLIGVPLVIVLLPIAWLVLQWTTMPRQAAANGDAVLSDALTRREPLTRAQILVAVVMLLVATGWITRPLLEDALPWLGLSDAGIAMAGVVALFVIPAGPAGGGRGSRFLLTWDEAAAIRWDVLILFGGGLALAGAIAHTDLSSWIGDRLALLGALPLVLLLLALGGLLVFVGELASNTAMAAVFLPVAGATAVGMGEPAITLTLPVALFATLGFMLPVATPPNAIVFGSGDLESRHMLRAGAVLDVVGIVVVCVAVLSIGRWLTGAP